jgi:hypothetical protein
MAAPGKIVGIDRALTAGQRFANARAFMVDRRRLARRINPSA